MEWLFGADITQLQGLDWVAPQWKILTGVACLALGVALLWKGRVGTVKRTPEMVLWGLVALLLALMNAEPMLVSEVKTPTDGKTVVLIDSSASMSVDSGGKSRFTRANQLVYK